MKKTYFLNIDLDLESNQDLTPLITEFEKKTCVMCNDVIEGIHYASFETSKVDIESIIATYIEIIENLGSSNTQLWNNCNIRTFDFGYQAGLEPNPYRSMLSTEVIESINKVGGNIAITIYPNT